MAKKSDDDKSNDSLLDNISDEMAEDIRDAVSAEDKPSKKEKTSKIIVTNWEDNQNNDQNSDLDSSEIVSDEDGETDDVISSGEDLDNQEKPSDASVDPAIDQNDEQLNGLDQQAAPIKIKIIDNTAEEEDVLSDEDLAFDKADDHEWHKFDGEDEAERPEWDEEKWQHSKAEVSDEEIDRPEWDDEKWQSSEKNDSTIDDEEAERPEWDEEKWQHSQAEIDENSSIDSDTEVDDETRNDASASEGVAQDIEIYHKEISAHIDSDAEKQDATHDQPETESNDKSRFGGLLVKIKSIFKTRRYSVGLAAAMVLIILTLIPAPRNTALNVAGVRSTAQIKILDSDTALPLKSVKVTLGSQTETTDNDGMAIFSGVRLGSQKLLIEKSAYQTITQDITIGLGSNIIEPVQLESIGSSFEFSIVDWLSGQAVEGSEVTYDENSAYANSEGLAVLKVPKLSQENIDVTISAPGYLDQVISISTINHEQSQVDMVIDRRHYFVSKRSGEYEVYSANADGSDQKLLVPASGNESDDIRFDVSPSGEKAVLVSVRDLELKNENGFVLKSLFLIDTESGEMQKIDSSERIDLIGWIDESMIYVKVQAGVSGQNPKRHRLMSLNTLNGQTSEIASSNYFNDVLVAGDYIFYAPSNAYRQENDAYLYRSDANGSTLDVVFEQEVWTVFRSAYDNIAFDSNQKWYQGAIDTIFNSELASRPSSVISRLYTDSPDGRLSSWVDIRDGKGALIIRDNQTGDEEAIYTQAGLRNPVTWLDNNHIVYRVVNSSETADYVISIDSETITPNKISDVTNVSGVDRWYFYY